MELELAGLATLALLVVAAVVDCTTYNRPANRRNRGARRNGVRHV